MLTGPCRVPAPICRVTIPVSVSDSASTADIDVSMI